MKNEFKLAGYTFTLKKVRYGIHSEETVDFMAELYCDGRRIATVENDGHGGATFARYDSENFAFAKEVEAAVGEEVWLTCYDGTKMYYDLGTVADEQGGTAGERNPITGLRTGGPLADVDNMVVVLQCADYA